MGKAVFVAGTDTGVGKTVVSTALVRRLVRLGCSVGVMKPVETGVSSDLPDRSDAARLIAAAQVDDSFDLVSPYRFPLPLAPLSAASAQGRVIAQDHIVDCYEQLVARHACLVVEGAGGLRVPMGQDWDLRDLICRLRLPVVLVGRVELGGINHALLSLDALEHRKIPVVALVVNATQAACEAVQQEQQASTMDLLRERVSVPVIGPVPYQPHVDRAWSDAVDDAAGSRAISQLTEMVMRLGAGRP